VRHTHLVEESNNSTVSLLLRDLLVQHGLDGVRQLVQAVGEVYYLHYLIGDGRDNLQEVLVHEVHIGDVERLDLVGELEVELCSFLDRYQYLGLIELVRYASLLFYLGKRCLEDHNFDSLEGVVAENMVLHDFNS